jgi:hypothetical protein
MGVKCGEWFEDGETVTYDSCPPPLPPALASDYFSDEEIAEAQRLWLEAHPPSGN